MPVDNHQLEIYQKIWTLILSDAEFRSISGITVGANNQIRVDSGKVSPKKITATQDGDLPELEILIGQLRDDGDAGTEDSNRPTFGVVEGEADEDPHVVTFDYILKLTYPANQLDRYFPLVEVIRRNLRGYQLRKAGLVYTGNTSITAEFTPETTWRETIRPQHEITVSVAVFKN